MRNDLTWISANVRAARELSPTVREFEIVPGTEAAHWSPGSHIDVGVHIDGRSDVRSYSLVGTPDGSCYRIAVKRVENSRGGSRYMWSLPADARLSVTRPKNHFPLDTAHDETLLIAA